MKVVVLTIVTVLLAILIAGGFWLYTPDKPQAELEAKYTDGPNEFRQVAGVRLHVRDSGPSGKPVMVLLHGFGSSLQTWDHWTERLAPDYRVIRFDLPGFGLTGPDPTGDYSDRRTTDILLALLDQLGVGHATLVGNSLGGKIAWKFAAHYPDRVDKLVLVSPDGFASPGFEYGKQPDLPFMVKLLPYTLPTILLRMSLAPAYADPAKLTEATVTRYRDLMLAPGARRAMVARMGQVVLEPPAALLARITAPTLLLWGEKDAMIPFTNAADYLAAIPHATLVALPDLGHVPFEEAPDRSFQAIEQFLKPGTGGQPAR